MMCEGCSPTITAWDSEALYTWCTGCGNYGIFAAVKRALNAEQALPRDTLLCFDVGCHGNGADKINGYTFHGLHGRVLPVAAGAALANDRLHVLAFGGDGGTLSEGINHLIHSIRNNYHLIFILHNNGNYALTKGQASATTPPGVPMTANPDGTFAPVLNPSALAVYLGATFVAREHSTQIESLTQIIRAGMSHRGFSFIEVLQDCPTFNKTNTHDWYLQHTKEREAAGAEGLNDRKLAMQLAENVDEYIPTGILYHNPDTTDFLNMLPQRKGKPTELVDEVMSYDVEKYAAKYR